MLEISPTAMSIFRECPMKYKWRYIDDITPLKKSNALRIGTMFHLAVDMYYSGASDEEVMKHIIAMSDNQIAESDPYYQEDNIIMKYTVIGMWKNYPHKDLSLYDEIHSEKETRIPMSDHVTFVCRMDRLVKLKSTGKWWLRELKTTGLPFQNFQNRVGTSAQASAYVWAMRQTGEDVQGIIYDFVKKPLLRKGVNESCEDFGIRIARDYVNRGDKYYGRHFEYRSNDDITLFEKDLENIVNQIQSTRASGKFYRNQDGCFKYNSECAFRKICDVISPDPLTLDLYFEKGARNARKKREEKERAERNRG